ncbi:hypothetical protein SCACP_30260 [Sporomusa carbonis]
MATRWQVKAMNERDLLKRLDETDRFFVRRYEGYLDQVMARAEQIMSSVRHMQQIVQMPFPMAGELGRMLTQHAEDVLATGQAHASILVEDLHRRFARRKLAEWQPWFLRKLASPIVIDPERFWLEPAAAIEALSARENMLANDVEGELWTEVKRILLEHLQGASRKETVAALAALAQVNVRRAELITTTETTYAYNRGRLAGFYDAGVDYVRFSAVMDMRTSPQCRSRHGKVMRMDSPELANNIPPLHGRCRSVLSPLFSAYQPEYLTAETLDWSKVTPLPKGWKTAK